ncbi:MAG: sulfatase-like hydrolase/transferase [Phycisphaera sp.]|nr:sulfatase-like hydrolase/transferase [Phycisphaera sp.]
MSMLTVALIAGVLIARPAIAADRPNIIFFLADDQRFDTMGCAGHPVAVTPTLDGLAKEGVRFTNMFVTTPICAASRATLFTGLVERTHGYTFGKPPISEFHAANSYPMLLKNAGYRTGFTGKYGIKDAGKMPKVAFDDFHEVGRNPYFHKVDGKLRHEADISADNAVAFIHDNPKDKPFCLAVCFNSTHAEDSDHVDQFPWPPAADGMFLKKTMPRPKLDDPSIFDDLPEFLRDSMNRDRWHWRWDEETKYQSNMRAYFRMLFGLDAAVGRVLDELKAQGLADNTVIIYSGDNGYYMGERGFAGKWSHFEQALRVPLIIYDPRQPKDKRGRVDEHMVLNLDIAPTILSYAGVDIPKHYQGRALDGVVAGNAPTEWRSDFFCEHLMNHPRIPKWEGVHTDRYVYARYFEFKYEFLHDLSKDPDELKNLVKDPAYQTVLEDMRKRCDEYRDHYASPAAKGGPQ